MMLWQRYDWILDKEKPLRVGVDNMRAEIIVTGSELLAGGVLETNSLFLSEELLSLGIETAFKTVVGDDEKDIEYVLQQALLRADIILITGGIGPTLDDITRKVIAKVTRRRLALSEDALKAIKTRLIGREYSSANDRQALIPMGGRLIPNPIGTAPGFFLEEDGKLIAALPGVPQEMEIMFQEGLRPVLSERFGGRLFIKKRVLRTFGLSEAAVNEALGTIIKNNRPMVGLAAKETGVDVRILARGQDPESAQSLIERIEAAVRERLKDSVYGVDGQTMEEIVGALLKQQRLTIAVAESCTGGLISKRLTDVPGSSEYFMRAAVVYSNRSKTEMLGVPEDVLQRHGAVSKETAAAMARGIKDAAATDIGLSVTGIAGPSGGSREKPVGLVYMALASRDGVRLEEHRFLGSRDQIRMKASQAALDMVRKYLIG